MLDFVRDYWWFIAPCVGLVVLGLVGAFWPNGRFERLVRRHEHKS